MFVLLALTGLFLPNTHALTPGDTIIRGCPSCTNAFRQYTIGSGNTMGAKRWTDGFMYAPMLPLKPWLVKCAHCRKLFWMDDAKELGRISFGGLDEEAGKKWDKAWDKAEAPLEPDETDYMLAAEARNLSRDRERYARQRAWWLANDPARRDSTHEVQWTARRQQNLERLAALFDPSQACESIWMAEIARELGQFDRCLKLLIHPVGGDWAPVAELLAQRATEKKTQVELLPECEPSRAQKRSSLPAQR